MTRRPRAAGIALLSLTLLPVAAAIAQYIERPVVPQEFLDDRLRRDGNALRFCLNGSSILVDFERAVAEALAEALLVRPDFHELRARTRPIPYDFRLHLTPAELFVAMANDCDALMGFALGRSSEPGWLTITRPYYSTRYVFVAVADGPARLSDLAAGAAIGTRLGSSADIAFTSYLAALPDDAAWRRLPYPDAGLLVERLLDGSVDAILVWEPALELAAPGGPAAAGIAGIPGPIDLPTLDFGIALPGDETYLRAALDRAIEAVAADGTIDALRRRHGLP